MPFKNYKELPITELRKLLKYDSESGILTWKSRTAELFESEKTWRWWNNRWAGTKAGTLHKKPGHTTYIMVGLLKDYRILGHILAWALHYGEWPAIGIDHRDLDGTNNRINNLRLATPSAQLKNRPKRRDNSSGVTGVSWHKHRSAWTVRISINGKEKHIGLFEDFEAAKQARLSAAREHGYETGLKGSDDNNLL